MPAYHTEAGDSGGRRQWVVALGAVLVGFTLLHLPDTAQGAIASSLRSTVLYPFLLTQENLVRGRAARVTVAEMQEELDLLAAQLSTVSALQEENRRLRAMLELRERGLPQFRSASVLRPGTRGSESLFLLDQGARDGIRPNMPVITPDGLAGVVREVGPGVSVAMDWTHPDFRASAMTADGEVYGMVEPRRGEFREVDRLLLNGVPYHSQLPPGTLVVTSGRGGIYPRGIILGTVEEQAEEEAGWRRSYWLRPAVPSAGITHVLVGIWGELDGFSWGDDAPEGEGHEAERVEGTEVGG